MSQAGKCFTNSKSAVEMQLLLKPPVLDCDYHRRTKQGPLLDPTPRISVHVEFSAEKQPKGTSSDVKIRGAQNIKPHVRDHLWSYETCAQNGCRECCGCAAQQFQCDRCAEDNIFALSKKIHEATLHDWQRIDRSEVDGYVKEDIEVVAHDKAASGLGQKLATAFEQETFEIVDGIVEMELVDGRVVMVWKDTMLMEDCGY